MQRSPLAVLLATALALPLSTLVASAQTPELETQRTEFVTHLADRSTRDLVGLLTNLDTAPESEQPGLLAQIAVLAQERHDYLLETIRRDPARALGLLLTDSERAIVDALLPGQTAQPCTLSGHLNVLADGNAYPWENPAPYTLFESTSGVDLNLRTAGEALGSARGGSSVQIEGYLLDDELLFEGDSASLTVLAGPAGLPPTAEILPVIVKFSNQPPALLPIQYPQISSIYNSSPTGVNAYDSEVSYGQLQIHADTDTTLAQLGSGPVTLAAPMTNSTKQIRDAVVAHIENNTTIDLNQYYAIGIFFDWTQVIPPPPFFNAATVGQQMVPSSVAGHAPYKLAILYMGGGNSITTAYSNIHETGHALGADHSSFIRINPTSNGGIYPPESVCEYGDPVAVMGSGNAGNKPGICNAPQTGMGHISGMHKFLLGPWIDPVLEKATYVPGSGPEDYVLRPLAANTSGLADPLHLLQIPRGNMDSLYVDFRYPMGLFETAAFLAQASIPATGAALFYVHPKGIQSALIDPIWTQTTHPNASSAAVNPNESFTDPCNHVTVTVETITPPTGGEPARMLVHVDSNGDCNYTGSPHVSFVSPPSGAYLPGYGGVVVQVSGFENIANVKVKLSTLVDGKPVVFSTLSPDPVTHQVAFPPTGTQWNKLSEGPHILTSTMTETPPNCCPYTATVRRRIRWNKSLGVPPAPPTVARPLPSVSPPSRPFTLTSTASSDDGIACVEYWFDPAYSDTCGVGEAHNGPHPANCKYQAFFPTYSHNFPVGTTDRGAFFLGSATETPYSLTVSSIPPGTYSVWCRAFGLQGQASLSDPVQWTIDGTVPFAVTLDPADGSTVSRGASVSLTANVTAEEGEDGYVDFFVDNVFVGSDDTAPYSVQWLVPEAPNTTYSVRAEAHGIGGRTASVSSSVVSSGG